MSRYDIRFEPEDVIVSDWLDMYPVRFVYYDGEWWAVLKDVCDALGTKVKDTSYRIDTYDLLLADIPVSEVDSIEVRSRGHNPYREMYIVNQGGILDIVNVSRKDAARKFKRWVKDILIQLRKDAGLEGYEIDKFMFDPKVRREVEERYEWNFSDDTYYDEERDRVYTEIRMDCHGNPIDPEEDCV